MYGFLSQSSGIYKICVICSSKLLRRKASFSHITGFLIFKQNSSKTFNSNKIQMKINLWMQMYLVPGND